MVEALQDDRIGEEQVPLCSRRELCCLARALARLELLPSACLGSSETAGSLCHQACLSTDTGFVSYVARTQAKASHLHSERSLEEGTGTKPECMEGGIGGGKGLAGLV